LHLIFHKSFSISKSNVADASFINLCISSLVISALACSIISQYSLIVSSQYTSVRNFLFNSEILLSFASSIRSEMILSALDSILWAVVDHKIIFSIKHGCLIATHCAIIHHWEVQKILHNFIHTFVIALYVSSAMSYML